MFPFFDLHTTSEIHTKDSSLLSGYMVFRAHFLQIWELKIYTKTATDKYVLIKS